MNENPQNLPNTTDRSYENLPRDEVVAALEKVLHFSLDDIRAIPTKFKPAESVTMARVAWIYCLEKLADMSHMQVGEFLNVGKTGGSVAAAYEKADREMARRVGENPIRSHVLEVCKHWRIDARALAQRRKQLPE